MPSSVPVEGAATSDAARGAQCTHRTHRTWLHEDESRAGPRAAADAGVTDDRVNIL